MTEIKGASLSFMFFNLQHPIFRDNRLLRVAISKAFDRERVIQLIFQGHATLAQSIIPTGLGYDPNYTNPNAVYDVEEAKKLLEEAGYPEGKGLPEIIFNIPTGREEYKKLAEVFQACMRDIGISVKVVQLPFNDMTTKAKEKGNTTWMLCSYVWGADYPDAENFLQLLYGKNKGGSNTTWYDNPEFNSLYDEAACMVDGPARTDLYIKMKKIAARDMPALFLWTKKHYTFYHPWLKNYRRTEFHYGIQKYLDVDKKNPKEKNS